MTSTHFHNSVCHTTTSGGLGALPCGSLFPPPRGVEDACRCPGIAGAPPPTEETGNAIVWHTEL